MSLTLHLDTRAWREHLQTVRHDVPGLVPVAKGNGYGFGLRRLAAEALLLDLDTLAVGTSAEVAEVRAGGWDRDIVVLTPWSRHDPVAVDLLADPLVITTVSRLDDLADIGTRAPQARILCELLTSMCRHGLARRDLTKLRGLTHDLQFEGWTIHLPMRGADLLAEARDLAQAATATIGAPVWLSHLPPADYTRLRAELNVESRLRMGTPLWLGAPDSRRITARVLDVHPVRRGQHIGYWQRRAPKDGWVVVVSGGTANGVALSAPTAAATLRQRLVTVASGALDASGHALSPYTIAGRKRMFVEPPHMQSSLVFLPGAGSVALGDEVPVELRLTTATVDQVIDDN
ncbi:alanine racemase [Tessaracoccus sp. SD287]|uniref:alanine racemase n=1 Tax=Tessaracoccus sp. SD287 TaxID=2782008 RepID=UPI001A966984|nr:alanine racemase [Tessaracoccus sp. SD287]MBO1031835.1 alanine racemase [Tessaracoccus sp. SD287]